MLGAGRPCADPPNLKPKTVPLRATKPLWKVKMSSFGRCVPCLLKSLVFNYPDELGLAYSTVFGGKPPKQNRPLGRSRFNRWTLSVLFRLPRLSLRSGTPLSQVLR